MVISFVALLTMAISNAQLVAVCVALYILYHINISKAVPTTILHIMTPPPFTHNKNLNWKHHDDDDDDDDLDELQAAMILTCLGSTIPSATPSTSYDIDTTNDDDTDDTITIFHPVSPTSSITSSSPMMSSISTTTATNTKKHDHDIITPTLTSSPIEIIEVTRPAKKIRRHEVDCSSSRSTTAKPCVFPTVNDPEDTSFEKTLHFDDDTGKINSAHVHIRREVLEVKRSMLGRVYFQCKLHVIMCAYHVYIHICIVY